MGIDQYGRVGGIDKGAFVRFSPWHAGRDQDDKLITFEDVSIADMAAYAFGWTVIPREVYVNMGTKEEPMLVPAEEFQALTRSDNGFLLSIQADSYEKLDPFVLKDLAEVAITVDPSFDSNIKNAVSLFKGRVNFIYLQRDQPTELGGGAVVMERGLCFITSHDTSYGLAAMPTNTVAQCMNTIPNPFGRSIFTIKHTRNAREYLPAMKAAIAESYTNWAQLDVEVETLLATPYTRAQYTDILVPALMGERPERKVDQTDRGYKSMLTKWDNKKDKMVGEWGAAGQVGSEGTGWHALMGVNSFELWEATVKGATRQERQVQKAIRASFPLTQKARDILVAA